MPDLEKLSRQLDNEIAQKTSNRNYGGGGGMTNSPHWLLPAIFENSFGPFEDTLAKSGTSDFLVRWFPHPAKLPNGYRLNSTHTLMHSPSDPAPKKFFCQECFNERGDDGQLPDNGRCYFCDVVNVDVISPELFEHIKTQPPVFDGGPSGEDVAAAISKLALERKVLIPMLVCAQRGQKYKPNDNSDFTVTPLYPSEDLEKDTFGIVVSTNYKSGFHNSLLECYKEDPNMGDLQTGRWLKLSRIQAGQGHKSQLMPKVMSSPVPTVALSAFADYPDIAGWGKKPVNERSKRKTHNVKYGEAEHFFKSTLWFPSLVEMTKEEIDW